jgi:alpha/beta superfamily hydrolase
MNPAAATLRSVDLTGPAGRLEAVVNEGAADAPFAALVCHPHPLGGGTMHNKVVYNAMKALNGPEWGLCWPVLRFNFRGTGLSHGAHDGEAEAGDVLAALDWLENEYKRPLVVVGFSFGAVMALNACCGHRQVSAFAALGLPTHAEGRDYSYPSLAPCTFPKLAGGRLRRRTQTAAAPSRRRSLFYRSTGADAARAHLLAEGAIA